MARIEDSPWAISVAQVASRAGQSKEIDATFPAPSGIGDEIVGVEEGVAQRVASVQESDMILVMDSGRIMASGTHDELLATCDEYRSIYESQTKNQAQPEELAAAEQAAESSTAEPSETVTVTVTMPTADTSAADANAADTKEGEAR